MKSKNFIIVLVFLGCLLGGLVFVFDRTTLLESISCRRLPEQTFLSADFSNVSIGDEVSWIDEYFGWRWLTQEIRFPSNLKTSYIVFETFNYEYSLMISDNSYELQQQWKFMDVNVRDLLRCLGNPAYYLNIQEWVVHENFQTILLIYPEYMFRGTWYFSDEPVPLTMDTKLLAIMRFSENELEEQLKTHFYEYPGPQMEQIYLAVKEWPGEVSEIPIEPVRIHE